MTDEFDSEKTGITSEKLKEEIRRLKQGGPEKYREQLTDQGKKFVRDRLELYFDEQLFEDGLFANYENDIPADGMVTGSGTIDERTVFFTANDYSIKKGAIAPKGTEKLLRSQERALNAKKPLLYLVDSSGARIDEQRSFVANRRGGGRIFYNQSRLSGVIPQICVLYGPSVAGSAYQPVFSDFTVMVRGMSAMCIASPRMVQEVTGEEISMQELGGPEVHATHSGSVDIVVDDERDAARVVKTLLTYLPDNHTKTPPNQEGRGPVDDPGDIDAIVPRKPDIPYDMYDVLECIVDADTLLPLKPEFGTEIITAFARLDGKPVGIVANQPLNKAGAIYPEGSRKAWTFIRKCDAYNIPLLYFGDSPGFMVGSEMEKEAILEAGKRFIYATSMATVPKLSIIVRKFYGASVYAMCGPAFMPETTIALPSAEIAVMGPEAAVNAVYRKKIDRIDDPEKREQFIEEKQREFRRESDVRLMGSDLVVEDIVPPEHLRDELSNRLDAYDSKDVSLSEKDHGTVL